MAELRCRSLFVADGAKYKKGEFPWFVSQVKFCKDLCRGTGSSASFWDACCESQIRTRAVGTPVPINLARVKREWPHHVAILADRVMGSGYDIRARVRRNALGRTVRLPHPSRRRRLCGVLLLGSGGRGSIRGAVRWGELADGESRAANWLDTTPMPDSISEAFQFAVSAQEACGGKTAAGALVINPSPLSGR